MTYSITTNLILTNFKIKLVRLEPKLIFLTGYVTKFELSSDNGGRQTNLIISFYKLDYCK